MSIDLDQACGILEEFLEDPSRSRKVKAAIEVAIASEQTGAMELVTDALAWMPDADHIGPLKRLVDSGTAEETARVEAIRAIASILDVAGSRLAQPEPDLEPVLTQEQIDQEIEYLVAVHRQASLPQLVRRKALENAASLATTPAIHEAGKAVLSSTDPSWVATGLYVVRQCDPENALKTLEQHLTHENLAVRLEALQGYAQLGHKKEYKKLANLLYDSKPDDQMVVLAALAEVGRKKAGDLLWEAAEWMDGEVGFQAKDAYRRWVDTLSQTVPEEAIEAEGTEEEEAPTDQALLDEKARKAEATEEGYWVETPGDGFGGEGGGDD